MEHNDIVNALGSFTIKYHTTGADGLVAHLTQEHCQIVKLNASYDDKSTIAFRNQNGETFVWNFEGIDDIICRIIQIVKTDSNVNLKKCK